MQQLTRLLRVLRPYWARFTGAVALLAVVGMMQAFRVLLMGPILGPVLNPSTHTDKVELIKLPFSGRILYLQQLIPSHFHNVLTVVVVALIGSTMVKGVCDYLGTYLVNYVGFGLITDLRNKFYKNILYRSPGFFPRHTTGTLVSTLINDIDKLQVTT